MRTLKRRIQQREYTRKWKLIYPEKHKLLSSEYNSKYRKTPQGLITLRTMRARYKEKYPERVKAGHLVRYYVRVGKLIRPKICHKCNLIKKVEAHHEDYSKPLQIEWLCRSCHLSKHNYWMCQ